MNYLSYFGLREMPFGITPDTHFFFAGRASQEALNTLLVAIGGLMRTEVNDVRGGMPGVPDSGLTGFLLRSTNRVVEKKELVMLIKPTIIDSESDWEKDLTEARGRLDALDREMKARGSR
jgi:type II secretory pathway component GspD/PulD (secretin)